MITAASGCSNDPPQAIDTHSKGRCIFLPHGNRGEFASYQMHTPRSGVLMAQLARSFRPCGFVVVAYLGLRPPTADYDLGYHSAGPVGRSVAAASCRHIF